MTRIVVLGTGTNVGKTYFAAQLAQGLARRSPDHCVSAIKPIESGVGPLAGAASDVTLGLQVNATQAAQAADAAVLAASSSPTFPVPSSPWTFPHAISPHLAARRSHSCIELAAVTNWINNFETARHNPCRTAHWSIVESAGAVFSPLGPNSTNFDLATQLDPALWILVAPDRLGVLHDLTVTLLAMRARGRSPDLVVLSQSPPKDDSTGTNAAELADLGIVDIATITHYEAKLPIAFVERVSALANSGTK